MAIKVTRPKTKNRQPTPASAEAAQAVSAKGARTGPVFFDEALGRLLPHCEDSLFEVVEWLNERHRRGHIDLLAGGVAVTANTNPAMLGFAGRVLPNGKAVLYIQVRQDLGNARSYPIWDGKTMESLKLHQQVWANDRATFEQHFPADENRGGRPPKYSREGVLNEAAALAVEIALDDGSLPQPLTLNWLCNAVEERMGPASPGTTMLKEILSPLFWRFKDIQDRRR